MKGIDHMSLWERAYFPEIVRGLSVTGYRFLAGPGNLEFSRKAFVEDKKILTDRSRDLHAKSKEGLYEEYVNPYRKV
jgi:hypothetical protein